MALNVTWIEPKNPGKTNVIKTIVSAVIGKASVISKDEQDQIMMEISNDSRSRHKDHFFIGRVVELGTKKIFTEAGYNTNDENIPLWYDKSVTIDGHEYYIDDKKYNYFKKYFEFNLDDPNQRERTRGMINLTEAYDNHLKLDYLILSHTMNCEDGIHVLPYAVIYAKTLPLYVSESMVKTGFYYDHRVAEEFSDYYGLEK